MSKVWNQGLARRWQRSNGIVSAIIVALPDLWQAAAPAVGLGRQSGPSGPPAMSTSKGAPAGTPCSEFGPLRRAQLRQHRNPFPEADAARQGGLIGGRSILLPSGDDGVEGGLAETVPDDVEQLNGQRRMRVGKPGLRDGGELPFLGRPANAGRRAAGRNQALIGKPDKLLARRLA